MNKIRFTLKAFAFLAFTFAFATAAQAQATRTWVSGVGDDVNPCSRTAPCKTFAGAISKTAAGGEIDCLDPGGFGAVTTTKSVTIDGTKGAGFGSILASATNGVNVNDSATASPNTIVVTLRNLSINGAGTTLGVHGVNMTSGKTLNVEDCQIFNFSQNGINVAMTTASATFVYVHNTSFFNVGQGVRVSSTLGGSFALATLNNIKVENTSATGNTGVKLDANGIAQIKDSLIAVAGTGVGMAGSGARATLINTTISNCTTGISAAAGTTGRIAHSTIIENGTGISFTGGSVRTFGDNNFDGNTTPFNGGSLTAIAPAKQ
jgi:hypothetical protein